MWFPLAVIPSGEPAFANGIVVPTLRNLRRVGQPHCGWCKGWASPPESDVLTVVFPNGQGLEFHIGTLDTPNDTNRRDFVTLDETLEPAR